MHISIHSYSEEMALPGNWSEGASGRKELYCPRLHVRLKSFHQRLEVKGLKLIKNPRIYWPKAKK